MINDYAELKHKCLILKFEEFRTVMNNLYDWGADVDDTDDSFDFLWGFSKRQFVFKWVSSKVRAYYPTVPDITIEDIAAYFGITGVIRTIFVDSSDDFKIAPNAPVYIIYD
jgi:hypothetical protein